MSRTTPSTFMKRALTHARWRVRRAVAVTIDRMRRGDRTVIMTPPAGLRFGNWMYLWLDAHQKSAAGDPTVVLAAPGMEPWLEAFPHLRALTVTRDEMRFHDRREWNDRDWRQVFGADFTRESLQRFVRECIADGIPEGSADRLVINVRRGDYYARPELRERYGFDQVGYLRAALAEFEGIDDVLVVSDDADWCRANVAPLAPSTATFEYAEPDPVGNFLSVAGARRIIGMNSTFTYWAGYVADAIRPDAEIVMPLFHSRLYDPTDAHQLDPRWTALPGFH